MDAYEAIMTRRMVSKMSDRRPSEADIRAVLDAAVRAPTHYLTQPWRFLVLTGRALDQLGEAMARRVIQESAGAPDIDTQIAFERARPHRAPVIVVMVYVASDHPKAIEIEDRYAVGAAVENLLLAAHARGLGAYWRTGPAATDPFVREFLGIGESEEIAGFVYLGYAAEERPPTRRESPEARTEWRGFE